MARETITGKTVYRKEFLSYSQFVREAMERADWAIGKANRESDFVGATWDEACDLALNGYKAALPDVDRMLNRLEFDMADSVQNTFDQRYEVSGDFVDVGRFLSGEPECMLTPTPMHVMRTGRVIKLAVPVAYSAAIDVDRAKRRGVAIMALVEALALMQHPLEIWAVAAMHSSGSGAVGPRGGQVARGNARAVFAIKVQSADQPLDKARVMFALAHPSFWRAMIWAWQDGIQHDEGGREYANAFGWIGSGGHGMPSWAITLEDVQPVDVHNAIILPELAYGGNWSEESSLEWIRAQVENVRQG